MSNAFLLPIITYATMEGLVDAMESFEPSIARAGNFVMYVMVMNTDEVSVPLLSETLHSYFQSHVPPNR